MLAQDFAPGQLRNGDQGPQGVAGPQGEKGVTGERGADGTNGLAGAAGPGARKIDYRPTGGSPPGQEDLITQVGPWTLIGTCPLTPTDSAVFLGVKGPGFAESSKIQSTNDGVATTSTTGYNLSPVFAPPIAGAATSGDNQYHRSVDSLILHADSGEVATVEVDLLADSRGATSTCRITGLAIPGAS
jgi:hypothetical protein